MASLTRSTPAAHLSLHPGASVITRIEQPRNWFDLRLKELWTYRELLFFLVWRNAKVRYKQTAIGVCAFRQNHDYGYHAEGVKDVWAGEEAQENMHC